MKEQENDMCNCGHNRIAHSNPSGIKIFCQFDTCKCHGFELMVINPTLEEQFGRLEKSQKEHRDFIVGEVLKLNSRLGKFEYPTEACVTTTSEMVLNNSCKIKEMSKQVISNGDQLIKHISQMKELVREEQTTTEELQRLNSKSQAHESSLSRREEREGMMNIRLHKVEDKLRSLEVGSPRKFNIEDNETIIKAKRMCEMYSGNVETIEITTDLLCDLISIIDSAWGKEV